MKLCWYSTTKFWKCKSKEFLMKTFSRKKGNSCELPSFLACPMRFERTAYRVGVKQKSFNAEYFSVLRIIQGHLSKTRKPLQFIHGLRVFRFFSRSGCAVFTPDVLSPNRAASHSSSFHPQRTGQLQQLLHSCSRVLSH